MREIEHEKAVAKRMVKRLLSDGEKATKMYLLRIGWTEQESEYIIKKAKRYLELGVKQ